MERVLTKKDCDLILESLKYARLNIENHQTRPSYEDKLKRIEEVNDVIEKVKELKKSL